MTSSQPVLPSIEQLTEYLLIAPFHRWLGLKIGKITDSGVEIIMPWRPEIVSLPEPQQVVHGGILASLVDLTGLYSVLSRGGQTTGTAYMNIDYLRQATESPLTAKGSVIKMGRVISTAEIHVYDPQDKLLASGRGGYLRTV